MKNLYLIGGTMGVGKTTACQLLKRRLERAVFLDGDWCWDADPFRVTDETKIMVLNNICYVLNSFIHCSLYQNIILGWVMHEQSIIDSILSKLDVLECTIKSISLVCDAGPLSERLQQDINNGIRLPDAVQKSLSRIPLYDKLNTIKIDVSHLTPLETVNTIISL